MRAVDENRVFRVLSASVQAPKKWLARMETAG